MSDLRETFHPINGNVFIERLPRNNQVGSFILPDDKNKPIHEGVVIRLAPKIVISATRQVARDEVLDPNNLKPGDHVLYHHSYSQELEGEFITVNEKAIYGILHPFERPQTQEKLLGLLEKHGMEIRGGDNQHFIEDLNNKYILVERRSRTISGSNQYE